MRKITAYYFIFPIIISYAHVTTHIPNESSPKETPCDIIEVWVWHVFLLLPLCIFFGKLVFKYFQISCQPALQHQLGFIKIMRWHILKLLFLFVVIRNSQFYTKYSTKWSAQKDACMDETLGYYHFQFIDYFSWFSFQILH